ncbi:MAG TPA: carboxypeptidase-like regulatory domain-containing protein [Puia sp.]|nr:carboxypeptidase-like regulatory domain-containing protein [Puia sp.]
MYKKIFFLFFICFAQTSLYSQTELLGKVVDASTGTPVALASVFVSNTSIGTKTNDKGRFFFEVVPGGRFTLVVSCIGYESSVAELQSGKLPGELIVKLNPKAAGLKEIVITPDEKKGWDHWGDFFTEHFIGSSYYAKACRIKNHEILRFRMRHKDSTLIVSANEPLVIENRSLGYELIYELTKFEYNFSDDVLSYSGYPLFKEMAAKSKKEEQIFKENRWKVYSISMLHFMRSLYAQNAAQEGFKIVDVNSNRKINLVFITNDNAFETKLLPAMYDTVYEVSDKGVDIKMIRTTSNASAKNSPSENAGIVSFSGSQAYLNFENALQVTYTKSDPPFEYVKYIKDKLLPNSIISEISLINSKPIAINKDGSYYPPTDLKITGFWAWWEKIAIMLPYDYEPETSSAK